MNLDWTTLLAALGGGALGAAFGALPAFIFTGFAVIAGVAEVAPVAQAAASQGARQ